MTKDYSFDRQPPNKMLRQEYACSDNWIREFLIQAQVGYLASLWEGQPFLTALTFWYDEKTHEIYFHTNLVGRLNANSRQNQKVAFAANRWGRLLPSNVALEFSIQYESVVAFGLIRLVEDEEEKRRVLYGLLKKYFPDMAAGQDYRPITGKEVNRTAVYAVKIESWSGKRNWPDQAEQSEDWPPIKER